MGYGCLQTTFCVFNGIVAVLAAACLGIGAWALADKSNFTNAITEAIEKLGLEGISASSITNLAILIVIVAAIIMLIAGIGCCGAAKNNKCLLGTFFIAMVLICVLVVVLIVLVKFYPNKIRTEISKRYKKLIDDDDIDAINNFQKEFQCCGFNGPQDFEGKTPPETCKQYTEGCGEAFMRRISTVGGPLFYAAIVTLVVLVLATAISGYLYCRGGE